MVKVALVSSLGTSEWISCQSISNNLIKSYEMMTSYLFSRIFVSDSMGNVEHWNAAKQICEGNFDKVFFIEHSPHVGVILKKMAQINPSYKPELVIHIYGDFILHCEKWIEISNLLSTFKVRFVVASEKQKKIVHKMLIQGKGQIDVVPFPIDKSQFYFDTELRKQSRSKLQVRDNEKAILYTGRLSAQKNIMEMIKIFDAVEKNFVTEAKLFIAGPVDDIGLPYFGKISDVGYYNYYLQNYIQKKFSGERSSKIVYLGNLNSSELLSAYNMADIYLSLSTHHDEDYGMAPAEALMTGLPVMLSEWGGYADFLQHFEETAYPVKTIFNETKASVDLNRAMKTLVAALTETPTIRFELVEKARKRLSVESISQQFKTNLSAETDLSFLGFNELFRQVVQSFRIDPQAPFGEGPKSSTIYMKVYHDYGS